MKFNNGANGLKVGEYYILKAPLWSDSWYIIAECAGSDMSGPVFVSDQTQHEIDNDDIDGWMPLLVLNVA